MNGQMSLTEARKMTDEEREIFGRVLIELLKKDSKVQRAVLEIVWACPNVVTQI